MATEQNASSKSTVRDRVAGGGVIDGLAIDAQERGDVIDADHVPHS
jgi:hypothetical protein